MLAKHGVTIDACGGETADVGDVVRTLIVDSTLVTRFPRNEAVNAANVKPGHVLVGFASSGTVYF